MNKEKYVFNRLIQGAHKKNLSSSCPNIHFHDHYEIFLFLDGDATMLVNNASYKFRRGDLFLLNSNDVHMVYNNTDIPFERCCIHFDPKLLQPFSTPETDILSIFHNSDTKCFHIPAEKIPSVTEYFDKLFYYNNNPHLYASKLMSIVTLVSLIVDINTSIANNEYLRPNADESVISKILQYIDDHITEDVSLDTISEVFDIEKCYLCKVFKNKTGSSIMQFIISKRIALAKSLLEQGVSLHQACFDCGFGNYAHFSRTFKRVTGTTASKYRSLKK